MLEIMQLSYLHQSVIIRATKFITQKYTSELEKSNEKK